MAERSGLSEAEIAAALQDTSKTVSAEVIAKAPEAVRAIGAAHIGKGVCGYLSALEHFFGATTNEPTLLSVSFTSYLAGVFLASELLKEAAGLRSRLSSRYQIDPIASLTPEGPFVQNKDASCYCVQRADTIGRYRDLIAARS